MTFSLFYLDLESIHLTCAGFTYVNLWYIQMLLPLLYPVAMGVLIPGNMMLSAMAARKLPPTVTMMRLGWVPQHHFSFSALSEQYMPPMLYYFNMYVCHISHGLLTCTPSHTF